MNLTKTNDLTRARDITQAITASSSRLSDFRNKKLLIGYWTIYWKRNVLVVNEQYEAVAIASYRDLGLS